MPQTQDRPEKQETTREGSPDHVIEQEGNVGEYLGLILGLGHMNLLLRGADWELYSEYTHDRRVAAPLFRKKPLGAPSLRGFLFQGWGLSLFPFLISIFYSPSHNWFLGCRGFICDVKSSLSF